MRFLLLVFSLMTAHAWASGPAGGAIQGTLTGPSGAAITNPSVDFAIQILDAGGTCVMYQEEHLNVDLSATNGDFSLNLGEGVNKQNFAEGSAVLTDRIFRNDSNLAAFAGCGAGLTFAAGDGRLVRVRFDVGGGYVLLTPDLEVQSSPYAVVANSADKIQGRTLDLSSVSSTGGDKFAMLWDQGLNRWVARQTNVGDIGSAAGQYFTYMPNNVACAVGEVLKWTASNRWECAPDATGGGGGVSLVALGSGLLGGNITTTGTISVNVGTGANQIVQLDGSARLPAVNGSLLTNINAVAIQGNPILATAPSGSQVLKWNGSAWEPAADADSGGDITSVHAGTGLLGGALFGDATLSVDVGIAANQIPQLRANGALGIGTATPATGAIADFFGTTALDSAVVIPRATTGTRPATAVNGMIRYNTSLAKFEVYEDGQWLNMVNTAAGTGDFLRNGTLAMTGNFRAGSQWISNDGDNEGIRIDNSGNVGIGSTTPTANLDVVGSARLTGNLLLADGMGAQWGNTWIYGWNSGGLQFGTNSGVTMDLTATNKVGIGATPGGEGARLIVDGVGTGLSSIIIPRDTTANRPTGVNGMIRYNTNLAKFEVYEAGQWTPVATGNPTSSQWTTLAGNELIYNSAAFVGVGAGLDPTAEFHVADTGSTTARLRVSNSTTGHTATDGVELGNFNNDAWLYNMEGGQLDLGTSGLTRVTIAANGRVGVGTTSPQTDFHIFRNADHAVVRIEAGTNRDSTIQLNGDRSWGVFVDGDGTAGGADYFHIRDYTAAVSPLVIDTSARIGIGTTAPNSGSILEVNGTGSFSSLLIPRDTTANRPTGVNGMIRYNTNLAAFEVYAGGQWATMATGSGSGDNLGDHTATQAIVALTGTAATPSYTFAGDTDTGIYSFGPDRLALSTAGTGRLQVDSLGNIGIGTGSPLSRLHIAGTAGNLTTGIVFGDGDTGLHESIDDNLALAIDGTDRWFVTTNSFWTTTGSGPGLFGSSTAILRPRYTEDTGIGRLATHKLSIVTSGASRVVVDYNGAVGIGTTNTVDGAILDLNGTGSSFSSLIVPRDTTATRPSTAVNGMIRYNTNLAAFEVYANGQWATMATGAGGGSQWTTVAGNEIHYSTANVGIGTSNPDYLLDVRGTFSIRRDETDYLARFINGDQGNLVGYLSHTDSAGGGIDEFAVSAGDTNGALILNSGGTGAVSIQTNWTERMRILGNGNVGIGTGAPTNALSVVSNNGIAQYGTTMAADNGGQVFLGGRFDGTAGSYRDFGAIFGAKENGTSGNDAGYLGFFTRPNGGSLSERLRVTSLGTVGIGTTNPNSGSILDINGSGTMSSILIPRDSTANRPTGVNGMIRYNTNLAKFEVYEAGAWTNMVSAAGGGTPGGADTQIQFNNGGAFGGSANLTWNNSAGWLGVGTNNPVAPLHVESAVSRIHVSGTSSAAVWIESSNTGNNAQLNFVTATGAATADGDVLGGMNFHGNMGSAWASGAEVRGVSSGAWSGTSTPTDLILLTTSTGSTTNTERMRITQNGRVGLGTSAPTADLDVYKAAGDASISIRPNDTNASSYVYLTGRSGGVSNSAWIGAGWAGDLQFRAANSVFTFFDSSGTQAMSLNGNSVVIGSGSVTPGVALDINGTGSGYSSLLIPRDTTANRPTGVNGMIRYNTNLAKFEVYEAGQWTNMVASGSGATTLDGLTDARTISTTDMYIGHEAPARTSGTNNVSVGPGSLDSVTSGSNNATLGFDAGTAITSAQNNTALGYRALSQVSTNSYNTAVGANALQKNVQAGNTALGSDSMVENTGGTNNVGVGSSALYWNQNGHHNVSLGISSGGGNTASTTSVNSNVFVGAYAGQVVNGADNSVLIGYDAGTAVTSGDNNLLIGYSTGSNLTSGSNNLLLGYDVDAPNATGSNQMSIGNMIFGTGIGTGTGTTIANGRIGIASNAPQAVLDVVGTGVASALIVPRDTTAARAGMGVNGMIRYNTNLAKFEVYEAGAWTNMVGGGAGDNLGDHTATQAIVALTGTAATPSYTFAGDTDTGLYSSGANRLAFSTAGTGRVFVDQLGNVGIGTTSPDYALHVSKANFSTTMLVSNTESNSAYVPSIKVENFNGGLGGYPTIDLTNARGSKSATGATQAADPAGFFYWWGHDGTVSRQMASIGVYAESTTNATSSPGFIQFSTTNTDSTVPSEKARLTADGRLGIGTGTPGARLDVFGTGSASSLLIPRDTTANRPTGVNGMIRYNTNLAAFEVYANGQWATMATGSGAGDNLGDHTATQAIVALTGTATTPSYTFAGDTNTGLYSFGADRLALSTAGTGRLHIDPNGNVGIGTNNPMGYLDVRGNMHQTSGYIYLNNFYGIAAPTSASTALYYGANGAAAKFNNSNMANAALVGVSGTAEQGGTGTLGWANGAEGYVAKSGTGNITRATGLYSHMDSSASGTIGTFEGLLVDMAVSSGTVTTAYGVRISDLLGTTSYGISQEGTNDINYFAGTVGVGTTSPSNRFHVQDSQASNAVAFFNNTNTGANAQGIKIQVGAGSPDTGNDFIVFQKSGGTVIGQVEAASGGASVQYTTTSDRRLKENIHDTHLTIEDLMKIRVKDYNYRSAPDYPMTGFIAQDLYEVYPYAVSRPRDENKDSWGVDYGLVTPLLVKGVQDIYGMCKATDSKVDEVRRDVASLKADNAALNERTSKLEADNAQLKSVNTTLKNENEALKRRLDEQGNTLEAIKRKLGL